MPKMRKCFRDWSQFHNDCWKYHETELYHDYRQAEAMKSNRAYQRGKNKLAAWIGPHMTANKTLSPHIQYLLAPHS